MTQTMVPKEKDYLKYGLKRWIIGIGLVYLFIEFFWKFPFIWGRVPGIYWLFVFADKTAPQLIVIALGLALVLFLIYIVMKIIKIKGYFIVGELSLAFLICSVILVPTVFSWFPQNTIHVDSARIENQVYYLAVYPLFDLNYRLYQCDIAGVFCKRVFYSGDISAPIDAKLDYNTGNHTLSIVSKEVGVIYEYKLP
jgi:hypothetical protein